MSIGTATQPSILIKVAASPELPTILCCMPRTNQLLQLPAGTGNYGIKVGSDGSRSEQQQSGSFLLVSAVFCLLWLLVVVVMLVSNTVDLLQMDLVVKTSCDPADLCPLVVHVLQC